MKKEKIIILLIFLVTIIIITIALLFKGDENTANITAGHKPLLPLPLNAEKTVTSPHEFRGACHSCHPLARSVAAIQAIQPKQQRGITTQQFNRRPLKNEQNIADVLNPHPANTFKQPQFKQKQVLKDILTPAEQNAAGKMVVEGHWMGMETINLIPELIQQYRLPRDTRGVMVDEITLESAESGILAGDVITAVEGFPVSNLKDFFEATKKISTLKKVDISVSRLGTPLKFSIIAKNTRTVGNAQMESAPPIQPGALSPHRNKRRVCTECHIIMVQGGQLPVDAGDILPTPPPVKLKAVSPHKYRGTCNSCHRIIK